LKTLDAVRDSIEAFEIDPRVEDFEHTFESDHVRAG
jgi:hypothetical protein